jgi:hypothetical protein
VERQFAMMGDYAFACIREEGEEESDTRIRSVSTLEPQVDGRASRGDIR